MVAAPPQVARCRSVRPAAALQRSAVPCVQPSAHRGRTQLAVHPAATAAAAAAAAPVASGGEPAAGLWQQFSRLANALTNLFPVFVLGAALLALWQPTAFQWFDKAAITPTLAITM